MALNLTLQKRKLRHMKSKELGTQVLSGEAGTRVQAAFPHPSASLLWKEPGARTLATQLECFLFSESPHSPLNHSAI